jgi:hypothetical protein
MLKKFCCFAFLILMTFAFKPLIKRKKTKTEIFFFSIIVYYIRAHENKYKKLTKLRNKVLK